ncbi:MAG: PGF-pre-PGF domain-containing protein, partial [Candidatus Peribacteraceae bacterium]|nr:PGF-pre-PGF domain-containing protein [Candidatus Peribacteraceae bacterium]
NREITLVWNNGSDTETNSTGLYYNLRVGTSSGGNQIVSGVYGGYGDQTGGGTTGGYFGNMMQRKNITLKVDRLQPSTTYYWSVQTIDTGLKAGSWSTEQSFTTQADMEKPSVTVNAPADGYSHWNFTVVFNVSVSDNLNLSNVSLYGNWSGGWHLNETNSSGTNNTDYVFTLDLSSQPNGTYKWAVLACDNATNCYWTANRTFTLVYPEPPYLTENTTWQINLTYIPYHASVALGDIDNDGDLDMIAIGCDTGDLLNCNSVEKSRVYTNNGTSFTENTTWQQNLTSVGFGSITFGDIDNDGDLDLILAGENGTGLEYIKIYTNNGTSFTENTTWQEGITIDVGAFKDGSINIGDIDNDGDLDLVYVASGDKGFYINNGTSFVADTIWSQNIYSDSRTSNFLIDMNNDNRLDFVEMGLDYGALYYNNGTSFEITGETVYSSDHISSAYGDLDNDDDLDFIEMGMSGGCPTYALENNGTGGLSRNSLWEVSGLFYSSIALGDYDNNGTLDLANIGQCGGTERANVYRNNGSVLIYTNESNLLATQSGSIVWADIDNDNDLDLVILGEALVYTNNITTPNTAPTQPNPPANNYSYSNGEIILRWNNGSDIETGYTGLYYNLKVGTASNKNSIVSGVYGGSSNPTAGYFGNMMQRKNITLKVDRLQPSTTYYWSVQTIDTGLKAGSWSTEQSFTTQADMEKPAVSVNAPENGYSHWNLTVVFNVSVSDNLNLSNVSLYGNWSSGWHINMTNSSGTNNSDYVFTVNLSSDGDGYYKWAVVACDNATNCMWMDNYTFTLDAVKPVVGFVGPTPGNNTNLSATSTTINISHTEINPDTLILNWNGTNTSYSYSGSYTEIVKSGLSDGNHTYRVWLNDTAGNTNVTGVMTLNIDLTKPIPVIPYPENRTYSSNPELNFSYFENNTDSCWYNLNGTGNITLASCNTNGTVMVSGEGGNNVTLYMNDSAGNLNYTSAYWTLDTTPPVITIDSPSNQSYNDLWIWANATLNENTSWCGFSLNGTSNVTMNNDSFTHFYYNISNGLNEATHNITFSCNDTVGNMNTSAMLYFTIDRTAPAIYNVSNGTAYWNSMRISWDTDEAGNSSVLYGTSPGVLSLSMTNSSLATNRNLTLTSLSGSTIYYYNVSSCDSVGNCNMSGIYNFTTLVCMENWVYGDWGMCAGSLQTRTATDLNNCGTIVNRSAVTQSCFIGGGGSSPIGYVPSPETEEPAEVPENVTVYFDKIEAGEEKSAIIKEGNFSIGKITMKIKNELSRVVIDIKRIDKKPTSIPIEPKGRVYQYIDISYENMSDNDMESGSIDFKVEKEWIENNSVNYSTIILVRYSENDWERLSTRITGEDSSYMYYSSETPGFSVFAITGDTTELAPIICSQFDLKCEGDNLLECVSNGTAWIMMMVCEFGCLNGTCEESNNDVNLLYPVLGVVVLVIVLLASGYVFKIRKKTKTRRKR